MLRIAHRQRLEDQAVEDGEERRVGADAEREREDGNRGDERRRTKRAPGVAPVDGEAVSHGHVSIRLGMIDVRHTSAEPGVRSHASHASGKTEPESGDDGRQPEGEQGTRATGAGIVELVAEGVGHPVCKPRAQPRGVCAEKQAVDPHPEGPVRGHHARPLRAGVRASIAATSAASRVRSAASTRIPRGVSR